MSWAHRLAMPWARGRDVYCAPGRLVLKLTLGEAPDWVPTTRDVRTGAHPPASALDGGGVNRALRHYSGDFRASRLHGAAASRHQFGRRHVGYTDLEHVFGFSRTFRVDVSRDTPIDDLVDALRQVGHVEAATPHYLAMVPMQAPQDAEGGPADIEAAWATRELVGSSQALAYEPGDPSVIVALIDTGVEPNHDELVGRLRPGFDTVQIGNIDLAAGLRLLGDLTNEDMEPDDEVGHGTGCAGIIAARGQHLPPGLAGQAGLLPIRVLGSASMPGKDVPVGLGALPDIDDGLKRAIDLGAKVLNLSFGTPIDTLDPGDPIPHADTVAYGLARGCVMIAASGNSGRAESFSPACLDGVIAVGAVDDSSTPCAFSTRGSHVAICAPGERVVSAGLKGFARVTGTSFAAPFVTGAAALLVARAARRATPLGSSAVARLLRASAQPFAAGAHDGCGSGVLDAAAALERLDRELDAAPVGAALAATPFGAAPAAVNP